MPIEARTVTETCDREARAVYDFARRMDALPQWASGLAAGIEQRGGRWVAQSPMGDVTVEMAPENPFGVLDHVVTLPDGTSVHNAFRVSPAGTGSVLTFVVLLPAGASDEAFASDVAHVARDLRTLRDLVEKRA